MAQDLDPGRLLRPVGRTPTQAGTHELPPDLVQKGVNRLGFLGLIIAVMAPAGYVTEYFLQPSRIGSPNGAPLAAISTAALALAGIVMCVLCWTRRLSSDTILDAGLWFEALTAFGLSVIEFATPIPADQPVRGVSWNCLWISLFVVAVPGVFKKVAAAAAGSAVMALGGAITASAINGHPLPPPSQMLPLMLPVFAAAGWAIPVARHLNRMTALVVKARELGSYELTEMIGFGGMGEVWAAKHRLLHRRSAIKLIRADTLASESGGSVETRVRRFEREARSIASLRSPHTVALYDFGMSEDGRFFYVMELLDGVDLEALVRRFGPLPPARVIHILLQALKSLGEAHGQGLVHRDVKPRNILVCRQGTDCDFVKVLDFGLVKYDPARSQAETALTREGIATGTPSFMAPEVSLGSPNIDARADIYALGCVAYWLLTAQLVFDRPTAMAMVLAHIQTPPDAPSQRTGIPIPPCLEEIVLSCLQKGPDSRPQSAAELVRRLKSCKIDGTWTAEDAESWWQANLPTSRPAPNPASPAELSNTL